MRRWRSSPFWRTNRSTTRNAAAPADEGVTVLSDGAYINTGLVAPHRKRPGRDLLAAEEEDNAEHRSVRARVEHAFARMKHYKILRDCRQRGSGLHHAVQAVAHMHNLALAA
ncbi:transposase family protein [Streptomyces sp. NPDC002870]|uniref:transposase family protein n=1 Tax=Streptomyces sp. NPDC002870 TaxID=3364666 RepID=UPI00369F8E3F